MNKFILFFLIIFLGIFIVSSSSSKIEKQVLDKLEYEENVRIIIELKEPSLEKGFIFTTKKTSEEIEIEKIEIKEEVINQIDKEKVKHIFDKNIALEISKKDLIKLEKNPNIESIVIDKPIYAFLQDSVPHINATTSWPIQISGINITGIDETICVLDTGIDFSHPALNGKNKTCIIDCVGKACIEDCSIGDDNGHGTHVAGIAAASTEIDGVAVGADLIGVKVLDSAGTGSTSDLNAAIDWCINNASLYNISVMSMSLGDQTNQSTYCNSDSSASHINNAVANNISVIVAAGNCDGVNCIGGISAPACVENATAVGTVNDANEVISFQRGPLFELLAPGININSTSSSGGYQIQSGTSMSTPHVAGAFAIIRQFFRLQNNRIPTPTEIKILLNNTGKLIDDTSNSGFNYTRINIYSALISIDTTNPTVNLISPANNQINFTQNMTFKCSANDVSLSNLTLYVWNSTELYNTTLIDVNGTNIDAEFNLTNMPNEEYLWNCLAYDHNNNFSFASSNYSLTLTSINTILNSPLNNTFTNQQEQNFNCSVETSSSKELSNVTFYIWNSTELIYNITNNISGISNSTVFNYTFTNETNYIWNCKSFNNESNFTFAKNNFTLTYDITKPNLTLIEPFPASATSSSVSRIFYYNVTDNYNINNCSLIVNNAISLTNASINSSSTNNFTKTFTPGTYNWKINCTDIAGNVRNSSEKSFTITTPAVAPSSGGGGGGGGGGSSIKTYTAFPEQTSTGYTKTLAKNDKIKFTISNEITQQHTITTNFVGIDYVDLTVQSDPINFILYIGEEKKLNLTSLEYYNLYIKLNSIKNKRANLTIQTIHEQIFKVPEEMKIPGNKTSDKEFFEEEIFPKIGELNYFRNLVITILIIVIFVLYIIENRLKKKHKKVKKNKSNKKKIKNESTKTKRKRK